LVQTGEDTFERRTLTGTANEITVTDGDGVADNPTVSLPAALTFTGKTVTGGTFESPAINTPTGIVKGDVGLGNVDNTSDATKNAASATLTNKTIDTAGPNTIKINGNTLAASAGTATVTIPNATDTLVRQRWPWQPELDRHQWQQLHFRWRSAGRNEHSVRSASADHARHVLH
jgi:hypothetical protein